MSTSTDYGYTTSTEYLRQQAAKNAADSGKVTHTDFLKLLVTQLTTQDPLNPMQDIDFTGQLAQLQALDEQMAMTKTMQAMRVDTQMQAGTAMIGKYISGVDTAGTSAAGLVARVVQNVEGVFVELANGQKVDIGDIYNVWNDANSMNNDLAGSGNVIGMWIEAGYDEDKQPIQGIIQTVSIVDGQVVLTLYGGKSVTWDQVKALRAPTEDEIFLYTFSDEVREKILKAYQMFGKGISGIDTDGNEVNGIVADAKIVGNEVYLLLFSGELIKLEDVDGDPRDPTADDAAKSLGGYWVEGLNTEGNDVAGIVVGAEEREDGVVLFLDNGQELYLDAIDVIRDATEDEDERLVGMWVEGLDSDGNDARGIVVERLVIDGRPALRLDTGAIIFSNDISLFREPTEEEAGRPG